MYVSVNWVIIGWEIFIWKSQVFIQENVFEKCQPCAFGLSVVVCTLSPLKFVTFHTLFLKGCSRDFFSHLLHNQFSQRIQIHINYCIDPICIHATLKNDPTFSKGIATNVCIYFINLFILFSWKYHSRNVFMQKKQHSAMEFIYFALSMKFISFALPLEFNLCMDYMIFWCKYWQHSVIWKKVSRVLFIIYEISVNMRVTLSTAKKNWLSDWFFTRHVCHM